MIFRRCPVIFVLECRHSCFQNKIGNLVRPTGFVGLMDLTNLHILGVFILKSLIMGVLWRFNV